MAFKRALSGACVALLALSAPIHADSHVSADTVVATVNGAEITLAHMIVLKQRLPAQYQSLPADVLFDGILDQLVQQTVLGQSGGDLSPGSQATLENEDRALRAAELIQDITDEAITEDALQAAYEETYAGIVPETEYNASHILFTQEDGAEEGLAREEALQAIADLKEGAEFSLLARERSDGPSGPNGGELGWFGAGAMVAPFEEAVASMEAGTVSGPVETQFGWHVIRLNETRLKEAPPLDVVRADLTTQLRQVAVEARVADLTDGAVITRVTADDIDPALLDNLSLLEN